MWIVKLDFKQVQAFWSDTEMWGMDTEAETHELTYFCQRTPPTVIPEYYGLDYGGRIVGVGSFYECYGELCLRGICVRTEYRGLGFGKRLIIHAIEENLDKNLIFAWAKTKHSCVKAYEAAGFAYKTVLTDDKWHTICRYNWKT